MTKQELATTSEAVYRLHGTEGAGLPFFKSKLDMFRGHQPESVIAYQCKNYPLQYALEFILSNPQLSHGFSTVGWHRVMRRAGPRRSMRPSDMQPDGLADLVFLCRYLDIDAVHAYLSLPVPRQDKARVRQWVYQTCPAFFGKADDEDDLDGQYFMAAADLMRLRRRALDTGSWRRMPRSPGVWGRDLW